MMRVRRWLVVAAVATLALHPLPAVGAVALSARLVDFTPWLEPGGTLRAALSVTNTGSDAATQLQVGIQIHEGIDTRSQLERSFAGSLGPLVGSDTIPVDAQIDPGATQVITVEKPLAEIRFFSGTPDDRAYPVRMVVKSGRINSLPVDTHMIFFSRPAPVPLAVVVAIPLHAPAIHSVDLQVASDSSARALTDGRIPALLEALENRPDASVALSASGLLLDSLADLADGYRLAGQDETVGADSPVASSAATTLGRIRAIAARPGTQSVVSPYAQPNLVWLSSSGLGARAVAQIREGTKRMRESITDNPSGWLLAPMGVIDEPVLTLLKRSGTSGVIVSSSAIPATRSNFTRTAPVEIRTGGEALMPGLVTDAGLDLRLRSDPGLAPVVARQRFLAETATIMVERPSERRVVAISAPANWAPDRVLVDGILLALAQSPWMRSITPDEALSQVPPTSSVGLLEDERILDAIAEPPPDSYAEALERALEAIAQYSDLGPPPGRLAELEHRLMIAESSDWWGSRRVQSRGLTYASAVESKVRREFSKIKAPSPQTITLTSRNGVIPLVISTQTDYPIQIVIKLESDKLRFPNGTEITTALEPPARTIQVAAVAKSSGTFPVQVVISTPGGNLELSSSRIVVRSTAYNVVAVAITAGAGMFMVLGWLVAAIRRRVKV